MSKSSVRTHYGFPEARLVKESNQYLFGELIFISIKLFSISKHVFRSRTSLMFLCWKGGTGPGRVMKASHILIYLHSHHTQPHQVFWGQIFRCEKYLTDKKLGNVNTLLRVNAKCELPTISETFNLIIKLRNWNVKFTTCFTWKMHQFQNISFRYPICCFIFPPTLRSTISNADFPVRYSQILTLSHDLLTHRTTFQPLLVDRQMEGIQRALLPELSAVWSYVLNT